MKQGLINHPVIAYTEEWKRTNPDLKVYIPEGAEDNKYHADIQNKGDWFAPKVEKESTGIASWGFPIYAQATDRIYVFYNKCIGKTDFRYDMSGVMCMRYSDDDGRVWSDRIYEYPIESKDIDNPDLTVNKNWIVWQQPYVTSKGNVIAPYSRWSSPKCPCPSGYSGFRLNRYPAYLCVAREAAGDRENPLRFGKPKVFMDTEGIGIGPGARTDAATYPSLLEDGVDRILFYSDRKHWLFGKYITDEFLAEIDPGNS